MSLETFIGGAAAFCTTVANVPQLKKVWETGKAEDLSLKMLLLLSSGLALWIVYGVLRGDLVIMAANAVSLALLACITYFKLRGRAGRGSSDERHT